MLDGAGIPTGQTTITDANGAFAFIGLAPGSYAVHFVTPTGYSLSPIGGPTSPVDSIDNPGTGNTSPVTLLDGQAAANQNAGLHPNPTPPLTPPGTPTETVLSLALSADNGASNSDFITSIPAQVISGVLSSALLSGQAVEVSLDAGCSWHVASIQPGTGGTCFSDAVTLAGSGTLEVRVVNLAGDAGPTTSQAYVLEVGGATAAPLAVVPASFTLAAGTTQALPGISFSGAAPDASFTVVVSDNMGLLHSTSTAGVTHQGEDTTSLVLTGTMAAINAELASLTLHAGASAGAEWLWVSATDSLGHQALGHVVVTTTDANAVVPPVVPTAPPTAAPPVISVPEGFSLPVCTTQALAGISFSHSMPDAKFTVFVSDNTGLLHTSATAGVTHTGEDTTSLMLTGSMAAINAELATLTLEADTTAGAEWLWVSVTDSFGQQALAHVVVQDQLFA